MIESNRVDFRYSPTKLILFAVGGAAMTALNALLGLRVFPVAPGSKEEFRGLAGTVFFFACTCLIIGRFRQLGRRIVTLSATGITDIRLAAEEIPWTGVERLSTVKMRRQMILVLDLAPLIESTLTLTRTVRWSRTANRRLGIEGLATSAAGLNVNFDRLRTECQCRLEQSRLSPSRA